MGCHHEPWGSVRLVHYTNHAIGVGWQVKSGMPAEQALMVLVPEAYRNHPDLVKNYNEVHCAGHSASSTFFGRLWFIWLFRCVTVCTIGSDLLTLDLKPADTVCSQRLSKGVGTKYQTD